MAKKKQVVVSIEELKLKIKHEQAVRWMHSPPLFGILKNQDRMQFLTVDPSLDHKILVMFMVDPTDYACERIFELIELYRDRYQSLAWMPALILDQKYIFTKNPLFLEHFKKFNLFTTLPILLDPYSEFMTWANVENFAKVFFYQNGEIVKEYVIDKDAKKTFLQMETDLQDLFRVNDHGLPLPLLYEYDLDSPVDVAKPSSEEIIFKGHWNNSGESASTDDHNAILTIPFEGKCFRLITSLHTQARESSSRIIVTFNDKPVQQACLTTSLIADNQGNTSFEVTRFQGIYDIFKSTETVRGHIQIHFKNAANSPVIYWGCRIGN